jgi:hypothetical protein
MFLVQHRFAFSSSGTEEDVLDAVTETLLSTLGVTDEQLALTISSTAGSEDSERRLSSTEWQVDYEVTAGRAAADAILLLAEEMSTDATALTQSLTQALSARGLQLEVDSVALEQPRLVEATEPAASTTGAGAGGISVAAVPTAAPVPATDDPPETEEASASGLVIVLALAAAHGRGSPSCQLGRRSGREQQSHVSEVLG